MALVLDTSCSCPGPDEFTFDVEAPSIHYYQLGDSNLTAKNVIERPRHLDSFPDFIELMFEVSDINEISSLGLISTSMAKSDCDDILDTYSNDDPFNNIIIRSILPTDSFFRSNKDVTDSLLKFQQHINHPDGNGRKDVFLRSLNFIDVFFDEVVTKVGMAIFIPKPKTDKPFQLELTLIRESGKIVQLKTAVIK